jgi:hypothetical protein
MLSRGFDLFILRHANLAHGQMEILIAGEPVDALSAILHRDLAYTGKPSSTTTKELILPGVPGSHTGRHRQQNRSSRNRLRYQKDVPAKCYGCDIRRKRHSSTNMYYGSSSGAMQSIYSTATLGATAATTNTVTWTDLIALFSSLEEAHQPTASRVMSSAMRNSLIGVTDTICRPLFVASPNDGGLDRLLGKPIVINQYAPAPAAGARTILYGSLNDGYLLRTPMNLSILRTTETLSTRQRLV